MAVDIENDVLLDEEEDIKIWRGTAEAKRAEKDTDEARSGRTKNSGNKNSKSGKPRNNIISGSLIDIIITAAPFAVSVILLIAARFLPLTGWKLGLFYFIPFAAAGFKTALSALYHILNVHFIEKECIFTYAAILAFASGNFSAAVMIFLSFTACEFFISLSERKRKSVITRLRNVCAGRARVETVDGLQTIGPEFVNIGDRVHVYPGEQIPVDGVVLEGISTIDASPLTSGTETRPVNVGHKVYAGTINVTAPIAIEATEVYSRSTASDNARLIESAAEIKTDEEIAMEKYSSRYAVFCLIAAVLLAAVPSFLFGDASAWMCRASVFLAVSYPLAVIAAVPFTYFGGISRAAEIGVLFKGTKFVKLMAKTDTMVLEKTGIVTEGKYEIKEIFPVGMTEEQLLSIAATAEMHSAHPIAIAFKSVGKPLDVSKEKVLEIEEMPGKGISAFIDGKHVYVGNAALLEEHGVKYAVPSRTGAAVHIALDDRYCGHVIIADRIRRGAYEALDMLRLHGVAKLIMLTGDVVSVARPIANKLGFDVLRTELTPEKKADSVSYLANNCPLNRTFVFVGDGITDVEAMAKADLGIAMNALGRDAAMENADIAVLDDDITKLPRVLGISKETSVIVQENIIAAAAIKLILILLSFAGVISAFAAVAADMILIALIIANSCRAYYDLSISIKRKKGRRA